MVHEISAFGITFIGTAIHDAKRPRQGQDFFFGARRAEKIRIEIGYVTGQLLLRIAFRVHGNEKSGIDANGAKDRQPNPVEMTREVIDRNFLVSARPKLGYFDRSGKSSQCIPGIFKAQDFPR